MFMALPFLYPSFSLSHLTSTPCVSFFPHGHLILLFFPLKMGFWNRVSSHPLFSLDSFWPLEGGILYPRSDAPSQNCIR